VRDDHATDILDDPLAGLPAASRNRPILHFYGPGGPVALPLEERVAIGSSPAASIALVDPRISRIHCEIELREDGAWVRDLESKNGTFVDGVLVECARLGDGSILRLGTTDVRVTYEAIASPVELWPLDRFGPLVGRSVVMRELFARMHRYTRSDATVLIQGETGTGKEVAASALHQMSPRHEGPFVVVDCGAIPENLIEAELFGHAKGAFTGATEARGGAIEAAHRGTIFLDEVGELPLAMQPKLLRFLESRTVRRLGERENRSIETRVVSATHRDLRTMVNRGAFREDLYFRLAVLPLTIPPLRDRPDDLPLLVQHFLPRGSTGSLPPELLRELGKRAWEGNVRELRNFVDRALALGADAALDLMGSEAPLPRDGTLPAVPLDVPFKTVRERWLDHLEREYVKGLLERHDRNVSAVANAGGIDRTYVHRLMKKHGL
jgi:DNA-binding NtrC family response regulator